jgi:DNA polymerase III sliding clamp (beta) subunit (PCNA family)
MEFLNKLITIQKAASTDGMRYALTGVAIDHIGDKTRLRACDGHGLAEVLIDKIDLDFNSLPHKTFIVDPESIKVLKPFLKNNKKMQFELSLRSEKGHFYIDIKCLGQSISLVNIDMEYPDTERVKPKFETHLRVGLNPELLYQLCEAMRDNKNCHMAILEFSDSPLSAIRVSFDGNNGVLMPMRVSK